MVQRSLAGLTGAVAGAAALTLVGAPAAHADEWCDADPVMLIRTPGGRLVPVFYTTGVYGLQNVVQGVLGNLAASYTVKPAGTGTDVEVRVTVPSVGTQTFPTRLKVSSGPLGLAKVYGTAQGTSGQPMVVRFTLPVA